MSIACDVIACVRYCWTQVLSSFRAFFPFRGRLALLRRFLVLLSVIDAAKVSHFEIMCRVHGFEPTVGLFRCFYVNSKNKGWMSFSKRPGNDNVCYTKPLDSLKGWKDHFSGSTLLSALPYFRGTLVKVCPRTPSLNPLNLMRSTMPPLLRTLLRSTKMDLLSFIRPTDPINVRIGERERDEDEPKLLETIVGRVVPLLSVALDRSSGELKASVDKLFDEGGSGEQANQGDSASGGHGVGVQPVNVIAKAVVEDVAPAELQRKKKRKTKVVDAGEPSHPAKKLRSDYRVSGKPTVGGKSQSTVQRLFVGVVQHAEVRSMVMPTLPFVSSSASTTSEREGGDHTKLLAGANLYTIEVPQRFGISSDSSDHSCVNIAEAEVDSIVRTFVPIMTSATTATLTADLAATANERLVVLRDFLVCGIHTVVGHDSNLQRVYVPQWNVTNRAARQISLSAEVRMRKKYNNKERKRLKFVLEEKDVLLNSRCDETKSLKAQLIVKEAEAAEAVRLCDEAQAFKDRNINLEKEKGELEVKVTVLAASVKVMEQEVADLDDVVTSMKIQNDSLADQASAAGLQEKVTVYENCMSQLENFQDEKIEEVNEKFDKLCADFVEMSLHLEEKFYTHLLTTISGRRGLLTHGMELAIAKCLNFTEYISALGAPIGKDIEKSMQEGLSPGITHGAGGRTLTDVAAYNPSTEADYLSALQRLQSVNFPLITELKANKDASLMVPIHHSPYRLVVGASALSISLDVSSMEGTSCATPDTTTALSVTSVFASTISPISTDDYEIAHMEGEECVGADVKSVADESADPFLDGVSIALSKPVRSFAQCFRDFLWSLLLRFELAPVFCMACFVVPVDKVSWTEACASDPGVVISFHFRFAPFFLYCSLLSLSLSLFPSKLIPKASLFLSISTSAVLKVGMPISAEITAFAPYVNENAVSPLIYLIMSFFGFLIQDKMSQDVITVGSTMRILLLYRGEYSQWRERQMCGSEYGEQDRKAAILYEYETFKATKGEQLLDTYLRYLQVINDLKKCGYKKDNCDVNYVMGYKKKAVVVNSDPLALVAEKTVIKRKEKVEVQTESEESEDEDITYSSANKKPEYMKSMEKKENKRADEKKRDISKVKCYNYKKEGHFAKDCKKAKVKDYNYYKTKMLLAKKNSDEQVLLAEDLAWMESSSDSDQEINANMAFMAQIEKVLSDSDESSSSTEETIVEVAYYTSESKSESEYETLEYYDNSTNYGLFVNDNDDQEIFHDAIESARENFVENHIDSQKDYDKSKVDHNDFKEKEHLVDKLIRKFNHKIAKCHKRIEKENQQSKDLENQNKDLQEKYDVLINQVNTFEEQNNEFNEQIKVLNEKNADLLA
nr:hypothetical protein [Tanacetum cinerariifolium]